MLAVGDHHVLPTDLEVTPRARNQASTSDSTSIDSSRSNKSSNLRSKLEYAWPRVRFITDENVMNENERKLIDSIWEQSLVLPSELQEYLKLDRASKRTLNARRIEWDALSNTNIAELWESVKEIQEAAQMCTAEFHDEESWSDNVILPILKLSKKWAGLEGRVMLANM